MNPSQTQHQGLSPLLELLHQRLPLNRLPHLQRRHSVLYSLWKSNNNNNSENSNINLNPTTRVDSNKKTVLNTNYSWTWMWGAKSVISFKKKVFISGEIVTWALYFCHPLQWPGRSHLLLIDLVECLTCQTMCESEKRSDLIALYSQTPIFHQEHGTPEAQIPQPI